MTSESEPSSLKNDFSLTEPITPREKERTHEASDVEITDRQKEILQLAAEGLSPKEIARRIKRSVDTVNKELGSVYRKLKAENAPYSPNYVGVMMFAYRRGLLDTSNIAASANLVRTLSIREQEVLSLVGSGIADKKIAQELGITSFTVNKHITNILSKLEVSSRQTAALRYLIYQDMLMEARKKELYSRSRLIPYDEPVMHFTSRRLHAAIRDDERFFRPKEI